MDNFLSIDLGTTNSAVSVFGFDSTKTLKVNTESTLLNSNPFTLPSVFAINKKTNLIKIGVEALNHEFDNEWIVIYSIKRFMENLEDATFEINGEEYDPIEISSYFLKGLKKIGEKELGYEANIDNVVITVPNVFGNVGKNSTIKAAKKAGFKKIILIEEPVSALLNYMFSVKNSFSKNILVYDFGGGTFDVSLAKVKGFKNIDILVNEGEINLGGDDIDEILSNYIELTLIKYAKNKKWNLLPGYEKAILKESKKAKESLSTKNSYKISLPTIAKNKKNELEAFAMKITRKEFEMLIFDLIEHTMKLSESVAKNKRVDEILLVGGTCRIPMIKELLEENWGGVPIIQTDLDLSVSKGAAVYGAIKNSLIEKSHFSNVTSMNLGIEADSSLLNILIPKKTQYPCQNEKTFITTMSGMKNVDVKFYQSKNEKLKGAEFIFEENIKFSLKNNSLGELKIKVSIDENGIVHFITTDRNSNSVILNKKIEDLL